jgi:hypothetical protein
MEIRTIIHRAGDRSVEADKTSCDRTHTGVPDVHMGTWYMRRCVAPLDSFVCAQVRIRGRGEGVKIQKSCGILVCGVQRYFQNRREDRRIANHFSTLAGE